MRPKKMRPKAKWGLGRVFLPYVRVLKTRPQNLFFVVSLSCQNLANLKDFWHENRQNLARFSMFIFIQILSFVNLKILDILFGYLEK